MPESMLAYFEQYLRNQRIFSEENISTIKAMAIPKQVKKRQYLLRQGEPCKMHTFVCCGCLRAYRIDDSGKEHILNFSPANQWILNPLSLLSEKSSEEFIDALEDSVVIQLSANSFNWLLTEIPEFNTLHTKIITDDCSRSHDRIYMMISDQAEERYRQFIRHFPQLHQRLPVFMIASYLGITRETLTRIRSHMTNNEDPAINKD